MTNENIIKQLKRLIPSLQYADDVNAVKGAIQALSQEPTISRLERRVDDNTVVFRTIDGEEVEYVRKEPCDDAVSRQSAIFLASDLKQDLPDDESIADMVMAHNEGILEYQTQLSLLPSVNFQPCDDVISRQAVLDEIDDTNRRGGFGCKLSYTRCRGHIKQLPSVTQKSGKWIKGKDEYGTNHFTCPFCGHDIATKAENWDDNYCANCGADLRGAE